MSAGRVERTERVLDAAHECFTRHGVRKTTMDDIAAAADMSRPAVYQYVRSKDDAYGRLADRFYQTAGERARAAAQLGGTLAQRLDRILAVRLELPAVLFHDSPPSAAAGRFAGESEQRFLGDLTTLLASTITDAAADADLRLTPDNAREIADLTLALTRGLAAAPGEPERRRDQLRNGIALLVAGLAAATRPRPTV